MTLFASFNGGNPVLGLILLPFFFAGPFVLLWLEVRAFLRSEAQSILILGLILLLGVLACFYGYGSLREFHQISGFMKTHLIFAMVGAIVFPIALCWEAYKQGWLSQRTKKTKKKRRHSDDFE